ncbi:2Fe-2S iron-sulfur cluster-binding protein [Rhizorhabdus dicambivorans]|uniref:Ferredoxin n=1 Tax=Rhizorhabdus dicambivorans TaxID=1850238 RepID=A0A2A4FQA4_9SPHN|nr:2Fe-2S iron-sulfur cluster-binding protein [Rhizorhabdus dicambivorans]ATE66401.1 ferredoxin [Rhizorhabdus dicambivorans]PCE40357.1 ferredoxin [Rhizorhabdus dicambivorans]
MPKVIFQHSDGARTEVEGSIGDTLMHAATGHGVPEIEAECGGFCNCATCHVYIDAQWSTKLPPMSQHEDELLDGTVAERLPTSRLSCQIELTEELDGIIVTTPNRQT